MKKQLIKHAALLFISVMLINYTQAQQWPGYTLYSNGNATTAYLDDTNNVNVKTWTGLTGGTGYSSHLEPGGTLVRSVKITNSVFSGGGASGRIQKVDYNGNITWSYDHSSTTFYTHHDHCVMPNGNVLLIAYELKSQTQLTAAGGTITSLGSTGIWPDKIIEVQPTGATTGNIVWEWHFWDHLVQNVNSSAANYQTSIVDHPELLNINYLTQKDWLHCNGIDYNPILDQIVISSHNTNEWYVIDHSTTTAEAASHSGGNSGKGGDFLYRWGNPAAYQATGTKYLNVTHDAHWIPEFPGVTFTKSGRLTGFNNQGVSSSQSCADQITTPYDGNYNYTITPGSAFGPSVYDERTTGFGYTSNEGSVEHYPNGNTLVCVSISGKIYEITPTGAIVYTITTGSKSSQAHRYSPCYINNPAPPQPTITLNGNDLTTAAATTYQWYYNGVLINGATNQNYTPVQNGVYVVRTTDVNGCVYVYSKGYMFGTPSKLDVYHSELSSIQLFPNPSNGKVHLTLNDNYNYTISISDINGKVLMTNANSSEIDLGGFNNGIYFITISNPVLGSITKKITLIK